MNKRPIIYRCSGGIYRCIAERRSLNPTNQIPVDIGSAGVETMKHTAWSRVLSTGTSRMPTGRITSTATIPVGNIRQNERDQQNQVLVRLNGEPTAIAEELSDQDAALVAYEQRRAKTRALKQGLMEELLTGRTRLVEG